MVIQQTPFIFPNRLVQGITFLLIIQFNHILLQVTPADITNNNGSKLLKHFNNSIQNLVAHLFPSYPWEPWNFEAETNPNYWEDKKNQRDYLDWLGKRQGFQDLKDYYRIRQGHFTGAGWGLVKMNGGVASKTAMSVYKDHPWQFWLFDQVYPPPPPLRFSVYEYSVGSERALEFC